MIKIENIELAGWRPALRGMRNPKNSWNLADSEYSPEGTKVDMGENDLTLSTTLANAGSDHGKFLRMIVVYMDITAPMYFYKEFDTYKVGTVRNSCSTMHKIHSKKFERSDFSCESYDQEDLDYLDRTIDRLNYHRDIFNASKGKDKSAWRQMIQMLGSNYNQLSTYMLNYAVLRNMYHARCNHKLQEWRDFCKVIETLPYAKELIIGGD